MDACRRYVTMETLSMRHSPAFRGVCLYDEFSQSLDHDSSAEMLQYFRNADEVNYRRKHGRPSSAALRARDRFMGRPVGQRRYEDIEEYLTWPQHLDDQWTEFSEDMGGVVKTLMPGSVNMTLARTAANPGSAFGSTGTWEGIFAPLAAAAAVGYKDMGGYGPFPVSGPIMADTLRSRESLKVWPMLVGSGTGPHGDANLRQAFFTLSQNVGGLSYMQFGTGPAAGFNDNYSGIHDITTLTTMYGDLLLALERGYKQAAIL